MSLHSLLLKYDALYYLYYMPNKSRAQKTEENIQLKSEWTSDLVKNLDELEAGDFGSKSFKARIIVLIWGGSQLGLFVSMSNPLIFKNNIFLPLSF